MKQSTDTILMIRPVQFHRNEQTAVNNYYQKSQDELAPETIQQQALREFNQFVTELERVGIEVIVIDDKELPATPDSIFPNNWISLHEDGKIGLYPMFAENRRYERRSDILESLKKMHQVSEIIDFTPFEGSGKYLEGTGSMILDRQHRLAYAALSERTQEEVLTEFCSTFDFEPVKFKAYQTVNGERKLIYHTNVMMCIAEKFAIICLDAIDDQVERELVINKLLDSNKEIISISEHQVEQFAGNMLQVKNDINESFLVMSTTAYQSLDATQLERIEKYCQIIHSPLQTIEKSGGGSARCMMAEVFLPKK